MKEFTIGSRAESTAAVTGDNIAASVGSGSLPVFATPMMAALMENAAAKCADSFLDEGETTVGTYIAISHISATPQGMTVRAEAELISANGREIKFKVSAYDDVGLIGEGEHTRFVVYSERFMAKTKAKAGE